MFFVLSSFICLHSCTNEDESTTLDVEKNNRQNSSATTEEEYAEQGLSDNTAFKWEYSTTLYSSQDSEDEHEGVVIYPVKVENVAENRMTDEAKGLTRSSYRRNDEEDKQRTIETSYILISDPNIIYVGAAFPAADFGKDFSKEYIHPRNPIEISANFPDPYLGEITKETGSFGHKRFMKEVLRSTEFKNYIEKGARESLHFSCSEFYSYSDIEKAFSANAGLAKIFSAKVQSNSKKTNIKSRLLGQLISKHFTVAMETPTNGFFKDRTKDTLEENPVYIRSISYGKIALLSVESEYSFEEVKSAIEAGIKWKIFSAGGSYSSKESEILQKSTITVHLISDDSKGAVNQNFDSLDEIKNAFQLSYSEANIGLPIFCKGYYTKDNSIFKLVTQNGYDRVYNGNSRRSDRNRSSLLGRGRERTINNGNNRVTHSNNNSI